MPKILLVGEHPRCGSGTGNMMEGILAQMDKTHEIALFVHGDPTPDHAFTYAPDFPVISSHEPGDPWGMKKLLTTINLSRPDLVFFVGVDAWRYADIYPEMLGMAQRQGFKTLALAPYDLPTLRMDWMAWFSVFDRVLIYSHFGHKLTAPYLNSSAYFCPGMAHAADFASCDVSRSYGRRTMFPTIGDDNILVGLIANNQFRKDPMGHIEAFAIAAKEDPRLSLYLHMDLHGVFNIPQLCSDFGLTKGRIFAKDQTLPKYPRRRMMQLYNALDMVMMCSAFEGLSYTPLEAMLCGKPVIVSECTSHPELVQGAGLYVKPTLPYMVPIKTGHGEGFVRALSCRPEAISQAILTYARNPELARTMGAAGQEQAYRWLSNVMDINTEIHNTLAPALAVSSDKIDAVLFAQHSAAGDVLMTTQCFKGLKENHPGKRLVYMTQKKFHALVEGHPMLDEIIDWNPDMLRRYETVYNPHGERIVTGGFNSLDMTLFDMYPYLCGKLAPDTMFVPMAQPSHVTLPEKYVVIQTAGGSKEYRTYEHMDEATTDLPHPIVQIGSLDDPLCINAVYDMRGCSFKESAWVVKNAKAALVIDSYPAHLCGALGTPALVLFGPAPARITRPRDDFGVVFYLEPNRIDVCPAMTTCWGAFGKRPCKTPCINTLKPSEVRASFLDLLARIGD